MFPRCSKFGYPVLRYCRPTLLWQSGFCTGIPAGVFIDTNGDGMNDNMTLLEKNIVIRSLTISLTGLVYK